LQNWIAGSASSGPRVALALSGTVRRDELVLRVDLRAVRSRDVRGAVLRVRVDDDDLIGQPGQGAQVGDDGEDGADRASDVAGRKNQGRGGSLRPAARNREIVKVAVMKRALLKPFPDCHVHINEILLRFVSAVRHREAGDIPRFS